MRGALSPTPEPAPGFNPKVHALLLFDGECVLCNSTVDFVLRHDRQGQFYFAPLQSPVGREWHTRCGVQSDSVVLVEDGRCYTESTAVLRILRRLPWMWRLGYLLIAVPRPLRDTVYRWVARNRYRWSGRQTACRLLTPEERARFLA